MEIMDMIYSFDPSLSVDQIVKELVNAGSPVAIATDTANRWHSWWLAHNQ